MKDFEYYSNTGFPPFDEVDRRKYTLQLIENLMDDAANGSLSPQERNAKLRKVDEEVDEYASKLNREYYEHCDRLKGEFYEDARKELGYGDKLNEAGCNALEEFACGYANSDEYEDIFDMLKELSVLLDVIDSNRKEK